MWECPSFRDRSVIKLCAGISFECFSFVKHSGSKHEHSFRLNVPSDTGPPFRQLNVINDAPSSIVSLFLAADSGALNINGWVIFCKNTDGVGMISTLSNQGRTP